MIPYTITYNKNNNKLTSTERKIIKRIQNCMNNQFTGIMPEDDCLLYTDDTHFIKGIRIATSSRYYCNAEMRDIGDGLTIPDDLDKINEFARCIISEIISGKFKKAIEESKKSSHKTQTIDRTQNVIETGDYKVYETANPEKYHLYKTEEEAKEFIARQHKSKNYYTLISLNDNRIIVGKIIKVVYKIIKLLRKKKIIDTIESYMGNLGFGRNYLNGAAQRKSQLFVRNFLPVFDRAMGVILGRKDVTEEVKEIVANEMANIQKLCSDIK